MGDTEQKDKADEQKPDAGPHPATEQRGVDPATTEPPQDDKENRDKTRDSKETS